MTSDQRIEIAMARSAHYFHIMRTVMFVFVGIAAVIEFGDGGYSAPLTTLIIAITAFGILAGGVALNDIEALRSDLDEETKATAYGRGLAERNIGMLRMISSVLIGLVGLAELVMVIF